MLQIYFSLYGAMTHISPAILTADVVVREIVRAGHVPGLARILSAQGGRKPRGAKRLGRKLAKAAHAGLHRHLNVSSMGTLAVAAGDDWRTFAADYANTAYVELATYGRDDAYEPDVTALFDACAPRVRVAYDIGANWGYFSAVLAGNPAFTGTVHGFEIAPRTYRDYARMIESCGFSDRVTCHRFGLSDADGEVLIREEQHTALTRVVADGAGTRVPVHRLDGLGLPAPDFIKIDVEGHELAALQGGRETIAAARPLVIQESWFKPDDLDAMLSPLLFLEDLGYALYQVGWLTDLAGKAVLGAMRPGGQPGATNRLALSPLSAAHRPLVPAAINVVAVHPERQNDLLAAFTACP